jgi:hypothetical protein
MAALPYAEFVTVNKDVSIKPALQRDAGWDVEREGGPGDESGATVRSVEGVYRRLRHEREAPTTRANL